MNKQSSEEGWWGLMHLLSSIKNPHDFDAIMHLFLTMDERRDLADRYLIVKHLLDEKLTQREIAADLGVSISKITRGSNSVQLIDDRLKAVLKKNKRK